MKHPKCVEKMAACSLSHNFADALEIETPTRRSSQGRTRITSIHERKDNFHSTAIGGAPCKRKLDFHEQEDDSLDSRASVVIYWRNESLCTPSISLSMAKSEIRHEDDLFNKKQNKVWCLRQENLDSLCLLPHFFARGKRWQEWKCWRKCTVSQRKWQDFFCYSTCSLQFHEAASNKHFDKLKLWAFLLYLPDLWGFRLRNTTHKHSAHNHLMKNSRYFAWLEHEVFSNLKLHLTQVCNWTFSSKWSFSVPLLHHIHT